MAREMRIELVQVPVSDVDRAKAFYVDQVGLERGVAVSDVQVFPWGSVVFLTDPDGNGWALQAMTHRAGSADS